MPKIIVKNFGPLTNIDLTIKDFMLFIGPQASGKSTLARLIYFFKILPKILYENIVYAEDNLYFEKHLKYALFADFIKYCGNYNESEVSFYFDEEEKIFITFKTNDIYFSSPIATILNQFPSNTDTKKKEYLFNEYATLLAIAYQKDPVKDRFRFSFPPTSFIPASRSGLFAISGQLQSILFGRLTLNPNDFLDPFTLQFIEQWESIKNAHLRNGFIKNTLIDKNNIFDLHEQLSNNILKGKYHYDLNEHFIILSDKAGKQIPLRQASSGQQEAVLILEYILLRLRDFKRVGQELLIIEEPEAHLYPIGQYEIMKAISAFANEPPKPQIVLTTHSPYILTAINNLLLAAETAQKYPTLQDDLSKILPQSCWLAAQKVGAYYIAQGTIHPILEQNGLIGQNELDDASDDILDDFDKIIKIYKKNNL